MTASKAEVDVFLANYPGPVREIAAELREMIFATLPEPIEMVDAKSRLIGYGFGTRHTDVVCSLIPSQGGVKLGLAYGASLSDPQKLLGGDGKVHRHMAFRTPADVRRPGVKPLLKAAFAAQQSRAAAKPHQPT